MSFKLIPIKYEISSEVKFIREFFVEWRNEDSWAIVHFNYVWTRGGYWEHEPMPSSRSDDFLKRARWKTEELSHAVEAALNDLIEMEEAIRKQSKLYEKIIKANSSNEG